MRAVLDSSTLISLAWAGQLGVLAQVPIEWVVIDAVYREAVTEGLAHGHADAAAIERAIAELERQQDPTGATVDARVLAAAAEVGALAANDLVLGRRAGNLGAHWLRTGDLVVLATTVRALGTVAGRQAITALHDAGRLTDELRDAYLGDLR